MPATILSAAPYPVLNSIIAKAAKQTEDWTHTAGTAIAVCDSWIMPAPNLIYLIDSVRFYFLGFAHILNNNEAYGSIVLPSVTMKNNPVRTDLIIGRKDWLEVNREKLLLPPFGANYLIMI